jgi:hypothetical protein
MNILSSFILPFILGSLSFTCLFFYWSQVSTLWGVTTFIYPLVIGISFLSIGCGHHVAMESKNSILAVLFKKYAFLIGTSSVYYFVPYLQSQFTVAFIFGLISLLIFSIYTGQEITLMIKTSSQNFQKVLVCYLLASFMGLYLFSQFQASTAIIKKPVQRQSSIYKHIFQTPYLTLMKSREKLLLLGDNDKKTIESIKQFSGVKEVITLVKKRHKWILNSNDRFHGIYINLEKQYNVNDLRLLTSKTLNDLRILLHEDSALIFQGQFSDKVSMKVFQVILKTMEDAGLYPVIGFLNKRDQLIVQVISFKTKDLLKRYMEAYERLYLPKFEKKFGQYLVYNPDFRIEIDSPLRKHKDTIINSFKTPSLLKELFKSYVKGRRK